MFGISLSPIGDFAAVLAIAGLFFYGMYVGESRAHAADAAQHARQLTAVVAALQQQARERDAEVHKLTEASDNANRQIDGLLAPSPVPVVRLCYLRPAGGDQTRGASRLSGVLAHYPLPPPGWAQKCMAQIEAVAAYRQARMSGDCLTLMQRYLRRPQP